LVTVGETSFTATLADAKRSEEQSNKRAVRFTISRGMAMAQLPTMPDLGQMRRPW
jgi:hypothetical protein